jgi:hypothetical protein
MERKKASAGDVPPNDKGYVRITKNIIQLEKQDRLLHL